MRRLAIAVAATLAIWYGSFIVADSVFTEIDPVDEQWETGLAIASVAVGVPSMLFFWAACGLHRKRR